MSKLIKIIFSLSLILNVALIGFFVAQIGKQQTRSDPRAERIAALISEVKDKQARQSLEKQWDTIQAKKEEFESQAPDFKRRAFRGEGDRNFDRSNFDGSFRQMRRQREEMQQMVTGFLGDLAEALPAEKRLIIERRLKMGEKLRRPMR